jgi:hypothetical protein
MAVFFFFILNYKMIVKFIRKEILYNMIKIGRNGRKREKHFLLPMQEMGVRLHRAVFKGSQNRSQQILTPLPDHSLPVS